MSAPKRTVAQRPTSSAETPPTATASQSVPLEVARLIESRKRWLAGFKDSLDSDRTAKRTWEMLVKAGLESTALQTLWHYGHPPSEHIKNAQRAVHKVNRKMNALIRARRIEKERRDPRDPRADMFFERYYSKHADVVRCQMPFDDDGSTVGDWVLRRSANGEGMPDLPELRKTYVSLGERGPISDRKLWLFLLRCYGETAGVQLGLRRLTALANCADHSYYLDERTWARYLASLPPTFQASCRRDLAGCPPPPFLPPNS